MSFVYPQLLYLIPVAALFMLAVSFYSRNKRRKQLFSILGKRAEEPGAVTLSHSMRRNRLILIFFIMSLLIIACARPYWSHRLTPEMPRGRDIIVLFDVSKSIETISPHLIKTVDDGVSCRLAVPDFFKAVCCDFKSSPNARITRIFKSEFDSADVGGTADAAG